jgi:TetR/AcrR family transcriptional regulator of autoinduction and epiphytic fitness
MARNKRGIDAQVKRDEIAAQALDLFLAHGFEATSMAMISHSAGIAPNTIYWYFEGKDEVFVAALDRLSQSLMAELAEQDFRTVPQQLAWVLDQLGRYQQLIGTVHGRLAHSPVLSEWHDGFHRMLDAIMVQQLGKTGMSAKRAKLLTTVGTFVIEGLMSHPHSADQREAVLAWLSGGEA